MKWALLIFTLLSTGYVTFHNNTKTSGRYIMPPVWYVSLFCVVEHWLVSTDGKDGQWDVVSMVGTVVVVLITLSPLYAAAI